MTFDWSSLLHRTWLPASLGELMKFEAELGFLLPDDYRAFLLNQNGGKVCLDTEIQLQGIPFELSVEYFFPLHAQKPFMGVVELRDIQVKNRLCIRQALEVAADMGTGCYYLILAGPERGSVFFLWEDDKSTVAPESWDFEEPEMPSDMMKISDTFDELGFIIWNSTKS
jgi:hypothetical protein